MQHDDAVWRADAAPSVELGKPHVRHGGLDIPQGQVVTTVVTALVDVTGNIHHISESSSDLLGCAAERLTGRSIVELIKPQDAPFLSTLLYDAAHGNTSGGVLGLQHVSGAFITMMASAAPLAAPTSISATTPAQYVQLLLAPMQLEISADLRKQRAHRMEVVGQLATGLAHDLNNRLLVITGRVQFALDELPPSSGVRQHLEEVHRAADRASALTRQLVDFGRREDTTPRQVSLNTIVERMDALLDRVVGDAVRVTLSLDSALWPVTVDPAQIEQMILHLALNAKDAMPHGGTLRLETRNISVPNAEVRVPTELQAGDFVRMCITDTGFGMDASMLVRAFDPFFTTQSMAERTGLGLPSVYAIVHHARGVLDVESAPGVGTTFAVYLPRAVATLDLGMSTPLVDSMAHPSLGLAEAAPALLPPVIAPNSSTAPSVSVPRRAEASRATILIVDDETSVRTLVRLVLEGRGFKVIDARSGPDALLLAEIQRTPIDLLIADIAMPEMNGVDLAGRLRERFPALRVVFMSGYAAEGLEARDSLPADQHFIQKPFDLSALVGIVSTVLDPEQSQ